MEKTSGIVENLDAVVSIVYQIGKVFIVMAVFVTIPLWIIPYVLVRIYRNGGKVPDSFTAEIVVGD